MQQVRGERAAAAAGAARAAQRQHGAAPPRAARRAALRAALRAAHGAQAVQLAQETYTRERPHSFSTSPKTKKTQKLKKTKNRRYILCSS